MSEDLEADIVIVGAGSAGCVLANRLTEDPNLKVALIEAGEKKPSFATDVPGMTMRLIGNPASDWCHMAEPDPSLDGRSLMWSAGRMVGGGSSINGLVYIRGLRRDYDDWEEAGCPGWGWNGVEPYFRKAERYDEKGAPSLGREGNLFVSNIRSLLPLSRRFLTACEELQIPPLADYNLGDRAGAFTNLTTQRNGRRSSTALAYLQPAESRPNLRVLRGAPADKVVFDKNRAVGVRTQVSGEWRLVRARRSVVLSAGSLLSPTILLRSGIGPSEKLRALGIEPVADAPAVGANLQDHIGIMICKFVDQPTYNSEMNLLGGLRHLANYLLFRKGPLASAAVQGMAWVRSDPGLAEPDLHLNWFPFGVDYNTNPPSMDKRPAVSLGVCVSRPQARGRVSLRSADPADKPIIEFRLLEDEGDLAAIRGGVQLIEQIFASPALARSVVGFAGPFDESATEEQIDAKLRRHAGLGLHAVGTCRMGSDTSAVLDPELHVRGVAGLKVIDASIMPRLVSANTNAAAIMIGEKGADLLKNALRA
jgi:choline dehydrogenase